MASFLNSRWQTRIEHSNRSSNNGDMTNKAKRKVVSDINKEKLSLNIQLSRQIIQAIKDYLFLEF